MSLEFLFFSCHVRKLIQLKLMSIPYFPHSKREMIFQIQTLWIWSGFIIWNKEMFLMFGDNRSCNTGDGYCQVSLLNLIGRFNQVDLSSKNKSIKLPQKLTNQNKCLFYHQILKSPKLLLEMKWKLPSNIYEKLFQKLGYNPFSWSESII